MSSEQWTQVSKVLDFIMAQPLATVEAPKQKPKKERRKKVVTHEQLRLL